MRPTPRQRLHVGAQRFQRLERQVARVAPGRSVGHVAADVDLDLVERVRALRRLLPEAVEALEPRDAHHAPRDRHVHVARRAEAKGHRVALRRVAVVDVDHHVAILDGPRRVDAVVEDRARFTQPLQQPRLVAVVHPLGVLLDVEHVLHDVFDRPVDGGDAAKAGQVAAGDVEAPHLDALVLFDELPVRRRRGAERPVCQRTKEESAGQTPQQPYATHGCRVSSRLGSRQRLPVDSSAHVAARWSERAVTHSSINARHRKR